MPTTVRIRISQGVPGPAGSVAAHRDDHQVGGTDLIIIEALTTAGAVGSVPTSDGVGGLVMIVPAGGGDFVGPAVAVDGNLVGFDGTSGKLGKDLLIAGANVELQTNKNAVSGYAGLDGSSKITGSQQTYGAAADTACEGDDARLSDARTPTAHALGGAEHTADTLANLNLKVSDATLDDSSASRTPTVHTIGGAAHIADTLANLNTKVSDATLDGTGSSRPPLGAAGGDLGGSYPVPTVNDGADSTAIHDNVASEISAITLKASPAGTDHVLLEDIAAANAKKRTTAAAIAASGPPAAHTHTHASTTGQTANDHHAQLHAAAHSDGAGDEITVENLATSGAIGSVPTSDGAGGLNMDVPPGGGNVTSPGGETAGRITKFTGANAIDETATTETQLATAVTHSGIVTGNPHAIAVVDLDAGTLAELNANISDATLDDVSGTRTPTAHAASHENGGGDEINVVGLSGLLADPQTPAAHNIVDHDTTATGAELTELTDGSTTVLHEHADTGLENLISGWISGLAMSVNGGDPAKFDVAAGEISITDWSSGMPVHTGIMSVGPFLAQSVPDILKTFTTVFVNAAGSLVTVSGTVPTPQQLRQLAVLQIVFHGNGVSILDFGTDRRPAFEGTEAILDYINTLGPINIGNLFEAAATDLTISKTVGTTILPFVNHTIDEQDTTRKANPAIDPSPGVVYTFRDVAPGTYQFDITQTQADPDRYDDLSGTRQSVPSNKFTIQRCFFGYQGTVLVFAFSYGQAIYNSLAEAEAAIFTENPDIDPNAELTGTFTTALIMRSGTTDLTDTSDAKFITINTATTGGGGVTNATWLGLLDTSTTSYVGLAGHTTQVVAGETGLELSEHPTAHNDSTAAHPNLFTDDIFRVSDDVDPTKKIAFQASTITTATTRTVTFPDKDITLDDIADTRTPAAHTIASHSDTTATGAELDTLTDGSNADALHKHVDFEDLTFRIQDNADATKEIAFEASTITTGTVRTITMPDKNVLLDDAGDTRTPSAHTIASHSDTTATGAELETLTDGSNADSLHVHSKVFADDVFRIEDNVDGTKEIAFQASGITTATTRTITVPDKDVTIDDVGDTRPPAAHTIASHSDTTATGPELDTLTDGSNADSLHVHADFTDSTFRIQDNADATKEIAFQAVSITTATVRTITVPDKDLTLDDIADTRTPAAHTIASHSDTTATGAELETLTDGSNADALHTHAGVGSEFEDNVFRILDNLDNTKEIAFQASGITTATTRTVTVPDKDVTIDDDGDSRPPSGVAAGQLGGTYPNPTVNDGADGSAIHDNINSEISAITLKAAPIAADHILIEDSEATNAKKRTTAAAIAASGPPASHAIGGSQHSSSTIAAFNAKISDGNFDDDGDSRPPNGTAAGDLSGTYPNPTVDALQGTAVSSATPAVGHGLYLVGSTWTPSVNVVRNFGANLVRKTDTSDWAVNGFQNVSLDTNNDAIGVRVFADTGSRGFGIDDAKMPPGATNMTIRIISRAETTPSGSEDVRLQFYFREIPDNASMPSWSTAENMTLLAFPTNENWQYDEETRAIAVAQSTGWGLADDKRYQFQFVRDNTVGNNLTGGWTFQEIELVFD